MTYEIKLKVGFFKTQPYCLTITGGQIILTPQEDGVDDRPVIDNSELTSICIIKTMKSGEFEIITPGGIYVGTFAPQTDLEKVRHVFARAFGPKFVMR